MVDARNMSMFNIKMGEFVGAEPSQFMKGDARWRRSPLGRGSGGRSSPGIIYVSKGRPRGGARRKMHGMQPHEDSQIIEIFIFLIGRPVLGVGIQKRKVIKLLPTNLHCTKSSFVKK